tara:strand:+ start:1693 stop:5955 length:4263 start_codon:yes stop_codon:yes gene_type:complete
MVDEQSKGEYSFRFEKLRYNVFTQKITLENFDFFPTDSTRLRFDSTASKNRLFCELVISRLEIQLEDQFDFFFYEKLEIADIVIDSPFARIINNKTVEKDISISKMTGELYKALTKYFQVFELKNVRVNDAKVDYTLNTKTSSQSFFFNPFSFKVVDFKMDREEDTRSTNRLLFTEDFELNSGYQEFMLADSLHKISYDRFSISMKKEFVEIHNLRIVPADNNIDSDTNLIDLFIPTVKIIDIDFAKAYEEDQISIRKLLIERPAVNLQLVGARSKKDTVTISEKLAKSKLFEALASIDVERLMLTHSSASIALLQKGRKLDFMIKGLNYKGSKLRVDNTSFDNFVFADLHNNYKFSVSEIKHEVVEEGLMARVNNVSYSSLTRVLDVEELVVQPNSKDIQRNIRTHRKKLQLEKLESKGIHLSNFNMDQVVDDKSLLLASSRIKQPKITLLYDTAYVKDTSKLPTPQSNFLSTFLDTLIAQNFSIDNALISVNDAHHPSVQFAKFEQVDIYSKQFDLNSMVNKGYDLYDLLESSGISTSSSYVDVPGQSNKISWRSMNYSANKKSLKFNQLSYAGTYKKTDIKSFFKYLSIGGLSPKSVLKDKDRHVGLVELSSGKIEIGEKELTTTKLKSALNLSIDSLSMDEVDFVHSMKDTLIQRIENMSVHAADVDYNQDSLGKLVIGLRNCRFSGKKGLFAVDNHKHTLEFGQMSFSTADSTLHAKSIDIKPIIDQRNRASRTLIRSSIDYIDINGAYLNPKNVLSEIRGQQLNICSPAFRMHTVSTKNAPRPTARRSFLEIHKWLAEVTGVKVIEYKELNIENGLADLIVQNSDKKSKTWHLSIPQYSISGRNFKIDSAQKNHDDHLLYANAYYVNAYQIKQLFPDSLRDYSINHLTYSSDKKYLKMENLDLRYMIYRKKDTSKNIFIEGAIPVMELEGIKPIELTEDRILNLSRVHLKNPQIQITQFHKNTDFVSREMELEKQGLDKKAVKDLVLKELKLVDGNISWNFEDSTMEGFKFNHVSLNGTDIQISPNSESKVPKFGEVELSFGNFKHEVMKKFYDVQLDSFYLNSWSQQLIMEGAQLIPRYGIFEFGQVAGWEKSRLELYMSKVSFEQFKVKELLYNNNFQASLIYTDSLWVRNFKNKNYPMISRYMGIPTYDLRKSPLNIKIDSVRLNKGYIEHRQLAKNGVKSGKLLLTELEASASNITNDSASMEENRFTKLTASTKLMDEGLISAQFSFDLKDTLDAFTGEADISPFDATLLNDYIEPTAFVRIRKGTVKGGEVRFYANDELGSGEMRLLYKNLHVDFLNPKDPLNEKNRGLLMKTFLANRIVNTQNPHFFITKKGDVFYRRDTSRSVFHYWGNLAMSGVASSTGVASNKKEIKQLKKEIKRLNKEALRKEKAIRRREEEEAEEEARNEDR